MLLSNGCAAGDSSMMAMSPITSNDFDTSGMMLEGSCRSRTCSSDPVGSDLEGNFSRRRLCFPGRFQAVFALAVGVVVTGAHAVDRLLFEARVLCPVVSAL